MCYRDCNCMNCIIDRHYQKNDTQTCGSIILGLFYGVWLFSLVIVSIDFFAKKYV